MSRIKEKPYSTGFIVVASVFVLAFWVFDVISARKSAAPLLLETETAISAKEADEVPFEQRRRLATYVLKEPMSIGKILRIYKLNSLGVLGFLDENPDLSIPPTGISRETTIPTGHVVYLPLLGKTKN